MDRQQTSAKLTGCYVAVPTLFRDDDMELNLPGIRRHVRFLLEGGVRQGNGVLLACGAAGEFSTLAFDERLRVAEAVLEEAAGKVAVVLGAQTTSQRELIALAKAAERLGAVAIQVSPPFYHPHTDDDVYEFIAAAAQAADVGIVIYTTYWLGYRMPLDLIGRLAEVPRVVAVKWAAPSASDYERGLRLFSKELCMIDNQLQFVQTHMLGGRGINTHPSNY